MSRDELGELDERYDGSLTAGNRSCTSEGAQPHVCAHPSHVCGAQWVRPSAGAATEPVQQIKNNFNFYSENKRVIERKDARTGTAVRATEAEKK